MPLSVLPVVVLAMGAAIFLMGGAKRSLPASVLLAVVLLAQGLIPEPPELRKTQEIERAELLIRMGYPDAARVSLARITP